MHTSLPPEPSTILPFVLSLMVSIVHRQYLASSSKVIALTTATGRGLWRLQALLCPLSLSDDQQSQDIGYRFLHCFAMCHSLMTNSRKTLASQPAAATTEFNLLHARHHSHIPNLRTEGGAANRGRLHAATDRCTSATTHHRPINQRFEDPLVANSPPRAPTMHSLVHREDTDGDLITITPRSHTHTTSFPRVQHPLTDSQGRDTDGDLITITPLSHTHTTSFPRVQRPPTDSQGRHGRRPHHDLHPGRRRPGRR
jgi:hypothetical protein